MANERLYPLDIAKAFGIILVIIGHSHINPYLYNFIYSFHMPLFFLISGYFFHENQTSVNILKNNIRKLIIPYFATCFIILLINAFINIIHFTPPHPSLFTWIISSLLGIGVATKTPFYSVGPIWFLPALFWSIISFHFILKYKKYCLPIIIVITFTIISLYLAKKHIYLPFCCQQGALGVLFFYIGYLIRQNNPSIIISSPFSLLFMAIIWIISIKSGFLSIFQCYASPEIVTLSGAFAGSYFTYLLAYYVNNKVGFVRSLLIKIGQLTLLILCLHTIDNIFIPYDKIINEIGGGINIIFIISSRVILTFFLALVLSRIKIIKKIFNIR